jgi:Eukaryotic protein of unknown function (DUF829)
VPAAGQLLAAEFAHKLLRVARTKSGGSAPPPLLFHVFSGGGFIFTNWLLQMLADTGGREADALRRSIAGVVFDSSPAAVTADVSSRALVAAILGRPAEGIERTKRGTVRSVTLAVDGYLRLPFVRGPLLGTESAWTDEAGVAPRCPQLYLFSDRDALVDPAVIERFMAGQVALGRDVRSVRWHDSEHVDHMRAHPEEYAAAVRSFVDTVLHKHAAAAQTLMDGGDGRGAVQGDVEAGN